MVQVTPLPPGRQRLDGYGLAKRIEQISGDVLSVNQGTLYPLLLKLEQEGAIASDRGPSDNNFYRVTAAGRRRLRTEAQSWKETMALIVSVLRRQSRGSAMRSRDRFLKRLWQSMTRRDEDARFQDEMADHFERQIEDHVRAGQSPQDARRQALLQFGPIEAIRDSHRDERRLRFLETLLADLRYAGRAIGPERHSQGRGTRAGLGRRGNAADLDRLRSRAVVRAPDGRGSADSKPA